MVEFEAFDGRGMGVLKSTFVLNVAVFSLLAKVLEEGWDDGETGADDADEDFGETE